MVRVPQPVDLQTAIRKYYERVERSNKDIFELFGAMSRSKLLKLKDLAREQMTNDNVPSWNALYVNTESAYKAWGIDVARSERGLEKLKKMGLMA